MNFSLLTCSARPYQDSSSQKSEKLQQHLHPEGPLFSSLPPEDFSSLSTSMTPRSLLLSILVVLSFFCTVWCSPMCNNQCCHFVEDFPGMLRQLRADFTEIQDFYEANDDLDAALLDQTVEDTLKTPFACHAINSILEFYLSTVLPTAMAGVTEDTKDLKPHMESIQQIFDQLKSDVTRCRHYFKCKHHFDINTLNSTYTQMESKGLYKAMGELGLLFNYIETYMASKQHRNHAASV
ncbi:interleukin-10 isoform X2 [Dicentrarchus labrax]|uniref:Interleukin family protein n=1 Tax=Dicentrarchus labrax TaxID=13489 RepID=A0A8P4GJJ1_DICLA|nr:interleukin-10 isoform X2 [Dicentrarchus labrax]